MALTLQNIGVLLGSFTGSQGALYGTKVGDEVASKINQVRSEVRKGVDKAGAFWGKYAGVSLAQEFAEGAHTTGVAAVAKADFQAALPYIKSHLLLILGAAAAIVLGAFLWFKKT